MHDPNYTHKELSITLPSGSIQNLPRRREEVPLRGDSKREISSLWNNAPQNLSIRLEEKFGSVTPLSLHSLIELASDALLMSSAKNSGNLAVQGW